MGRVRLGRTDMLLLAGAALLRAAFLASTWHDPALRVPYLDGAFYDTWARSLAAGRGDFQGAYFLGPLYPYFLSCIYRLSGPDVHVVRVVQSLFGLLGAAFVLSLGRRFFGAAAARAAVVLYALYGPLVFYENLLVMESLLLVLTLAALWLLCVPAWRPAWRAALAGAALGLATLGRPTVLLVAPVVWWALMHAPASAARDSRARPRAKHAWRPLVAAAGAWLVVLLPVLVRNAWLGAGPVVATNGGVNFYAGNQPGATGRFRAPQGVRFFAAPVFESTAGADLPSAVAARALTVQAVAGDLTAADSRLWLGRSWRWIRSEPLAAAALPWRKAWLVLQAREIPQVESYAFHARRLWLLRAFGVDFGVLWPLAALGLWQARRLRVPGRGVIALYALALLLPCLVFFVTARYRLAVVPYVALFAGFGVATLWGWMGARAWRSAALALLAIAPLALAARVGARPPRGTAGWENAQMAERLYALGDLQGAIAWQERAAAILPERFEVQLDLALYWSERRGEGDLERAALLLERLVKRWPREPIAWFNWGVVLADQGRISEARLAWGRALELDPRFEPARSRLLQAK